MPRFDKTGPSGQGPKTGRGLGDCTPTSKVTTTTPSLPEYDKNGYRIGSDSNGRNK